MEKVAVGDKVRATKGRERRKGRVRGRGEGRSPPPSKKKEGRFKGS